MSQKIFVPPPPAAFVPPPPPGVKVPPKPAHIQGGVLLDMTDLFPTGKKRKKKKLPPWERRKKQAPGDAKDGKKAAPKPWERKGPAPRPKKSKSAPPVVRAKKGIPPPKAAKPSDDAKMASKSPPPAQESKTPPPKESPPPQSSTPLPSQSPPPPLNSTPAPNTTTTTTGVHDSPKAAPAPLSLAALSQPLDTAPTSQPLVDHSSIPLASSYTANTYNAYNPQDPPLPNATTTGEAQPLPTSGSAPTGPVVTTTESVVFNGPPAATVTVLKPKIMYAGEEQAMVVPPYPVPKEVKESFYEVRRGASTAKGGKETTTKAGKEAESVCPTSVVWRNQYDLQPSPSASVHFRSRTIASNAACSSTYVPNKRPAAEESWRGLQWRHTDVHRYVARRYFGNPPPAEQ